MSTSLINSEDCQGNKLSYYSAHRRTSEGKVVIGNGTTAEQSEEQADRRLKEAEAFLALPPADQLHILTQKEDKDFSQVDMKRCIKLLAKMVLNEG